MTLEDAGRASMQPTTVLRVAHRPSINYTCISAKVMQDHRTAMQTALTAHSNRPLVRCTVLSLSAEDVHDFLSAHVEDWK